MSIQFDGTELMNATYTPRFAKHESSPERQIEIMELAREDGGILVSEKYKPKIIEISGILKASSRSALDTLIDNFKELLSRKNKNLDIEHAGTTRRYVAYASKIEIDRDHYHNLFVPYLVEFIVPEGVGKDTSLTAAKDAVDADPPYSGSVSFGGSAVPKPIITLTFGSGWSNAKGIQFENTDTDEKMVITYSEGFSNGDILEIDCDNKTVKLNDEEIEFYGVFPSFQIGANQIEIKAGDLIDQQFAPSADFNQLTDIYGYDPNPRSWAAQSFSVSHTDETYQGIALYLSKTGTITNNLEIEIQTDNAGTPSGTAVTNATFTIDCENITSAQWYIINSTNKFTLAANTRYWIVAKIGSGASDGDVNNCINWWGMSGVLANYGRGHAASSTNGGSTWTNALTTDRAFKLLFGGKVDSPAPNLTLDIDYYKRWI